MRKVMYLITQSEQGGAQKYVLDMARASHAAGHAVLVASAPSESFRDALAQEGIVFREIVHSRRAIHFGTEIKLFFALYRLIRTEKPDVLHLNSSKIGALGALVGKLAHVRTVVFTAHGWAFNERRPWWQKQAIILISKFAALFQDSIICVSESDKKAALKHRIAPERKLAVIYNGIDAKKQAFLPREEARAKLGLGAEDFVVGALANLYKNKSLETVVLAAISAVHDKPESKFIIIGEGQERTRLENLVAKYHLEKQVMLAGARENAAQYLKAFDVFVLPSKKEGLPYALLEAMAAKIPCVASSVGGIPEIIEHEKNGLLLKHSAPGTLWDAVAYLLEHKKKAKELQAAAFETVHTKFSLERMVHQTLELYER